jgi:hypothetical protein
MIGGGGGGVRIKKGSRRLERGTDDNIGVQISGILI